MAFIYDYLVRDNATVRLVRFQESSDADSRLSLELQHASIKTTKYAALSYVWGGMKELVSISINGMTFRIGTNLHSALRQLRENGMRDWLWVDSLCIQQTDIAEKNHQVKQMGTIFSSAERVYSFLGHGNRAADMVMNFIARVGPRAVAVDIGEVSGDEEDISDFIRNYYQIQQNQGIVINQGLDTQDGQLSARGSFIIDLLNDPGLQDQADDDKTLITGIEDLMHRDYWHRIWINQEVALAKDVIVLCGTQTIALKLLVATFHAVDICNRYFRFIAPSTYQFTKALHSNFRISLPLKTRRLHLQDREITLAGLLFWNIHARDRPLYSATDPRDIIFALLGVITDNHRLNILPDYGLSTEEVFTSATRAMINESIPDGPMAFTLDRCVPRTGNMELLPTWVPDWRRIGEKCNTVDSINYDGAFDATRGVETFPYICCPGDDSKGILRREGWYVDTITEVLRPSHLELYERIEAFIPLGRESGPAEDYIWRTMHAQQWYDTINPQTEQSILCIVRQIMRQQIIDTKHLTREQKEFLDTLGSIRYREMNTAVTRLELGIELLIQQSQNIGRNRTLFKTAKGMLGMGHDVIEPGDVVSLIWGVRSPIVLRSVDGCQEQGYTFKGDAYVDGIMHGEFLKTKPAHQDLVIY
ncbi:hypothetical protein FGRMN_9381 [Fusarium graminum]|nr:hypothetical protein FGRMN_9381 [Fusarium graminum]